MILDEFEKSLDVFIASIKTNSTVRQKFLSNGKFFIVDSQIFHITYGNRTFRLSFRSMTDKNREWTDGRSVPGVCGKKLFKVDADQLKQSVRLAYIKCTMSV